MRHGERAGAGDGRALAGGGGDAGVEGLCVGEEDVWEVGGVVGGWGEAGFEDGVVLGGEVVFHI